MAKLGHINKCVTVKFAILSYKISYCFTVFVVEMQSICLL
jgi:hypothetical protein